MFGPPPSPGRFLTMAGQAISSVEDAVGGELNRVIDKVQDAASQATGSTRSTIRNPATGGQQDVEIHDPRFDAFVKTVDEAFKAVRKEIADLRVSGGGIFGGNGGGGIDPLMLVLLLQGEDETLSTTDLLLIMMSQQGGGFGGGGGNNAALMLALLG